MDAIIGNLTHLTFVPSNLILIECIRYNVISTRVFAPEYYLPFGLIMVSGDPDNTVKETLRDNYR